MDDTDALRELFKARMRLGAALKYSNLANGAALRISEAIMRVENVEEYITNKGPVEKPDA